MYANTIRHSTLAVEAINFILIGCQAYRMRLRLEALAVENIRLVLVRILSIVARKKL